MPGIGWYTTQHGNPDRNKSHMFTWMCNVRDEENLMVAGKSVARTKCGKDIYVGFRETKNGDTVCKRCERYLNAS